jgi:hypothetical protein
LRFKSQIFNCIMRFIVQPECKKGLP